MTSFQYEPLTVGMCAFQNAMDQLLSAHESIRDARGSIVGTGFISSAQFAATYGTVRCTIGRQTGQTEYIASRANPEDVIVTLTKGFADEVRRLGPRCEVIHASGVQKMQQMQREKPFRRIFVDESEYVLVKVGTSLFYKQAAKGYAQTFVMLGALVID